MDCRPTTYYADKMCISHVEVLVWGVMHVLQNLCLQAPEGAGSDASRKLMNIFCSTLVCGLIGFSATLGHANCRASQPYKLKHSK